MKIHRYQKNWRKAKEKLIDKILNHKPYSVKCPKCAFVAELDAYAIAQLTQGHVLIGKCQGKCGAKHKIQGDAECSEIAID